MKKSQKDRVVKRLLQRGEISRNECLNVFPRITRLSAIIQTLEEEGWAFETKRRGGDYKREADYVYVVKTCPFKKTEYINPITRETITTYK